MNRILVCDDEPILRDLIASHLCSSGFSVIEANGGEEALEELSRQAPDAVLLDLDMPKVNGLMVIEHMKSLGKSIPTVIITGAMNTEMVEQAKALGISGILMKPFNLSQVIEELRKYLPVQIQPIEK